LILNPGGDSFSQHWERGWGEGILMISREEQFDVDLLCFSNINTFAKK